MPMMKFRLLSLSGMMANSAVLRSPSEGMSSSSWFTTPAICGRLNFSSLTPREISILLAVLPETNCQGLFNQIHKKGARSTVWLLTPRLIDYIFPFSRSLQRYA